MLCAVFKNFFSKLGVAIATLAVASDDSNCFSFAVAIGITEDRKRYKAFKLFVRAIVTESCCVFFKRAENETFLVFCDPTNKTSADFYFKVFGDVLTKALGSS